MQSIDSNLNFLETSLEDMETYLLQDELFWPLSTPAGVSSTFPRLTIANVLLTLNELEAQEDEMAPTQYSKASSLQTQWEALHTKWLSAVITKSVEEMRARLNLWKAYITDLEEYDNRQWSYEQEVTQRVRYALLSERIGRTAVPEKLDDLMQSVDSHALSLTTPTEFVWDERLEPLYPQDRYIFLYRRPTVKD
jgi:hypothetical protein